MVGPADEPLARRRGRCGRVSGARPPGRGGSRRRGFAAPGTTQRAEQMPRRGQAAAGRLRSALHLSFPGQETGNRARDGSAVSCNAGCNGCEAAQVAPLAAATAATRATRRSSARVPAGARVRGCAGAHAPAYVGISRRTRCSRIPPPFLPLRLPSLRRQFRVAQPLITAPASGTARSCWLSEGPLR